MFIQVVQGRVHDADTFKGLIDRWQSEVAPGAVGWLGSTGGVTDDGRFIALVRFDSEDAARANSDRPEQGAWWAEVASILDGDAAFADCDQVDVDLYGDPDTAGFVQVMQGRTSDPARARELMAAGDPEEWTTWRPDIIGTVVAGKDDGVYTMAIYFTSEAEARAGEAKEPPAQLMEMMQEMDSLAVGDTEFFDLKTPWLNSASG